MVGPHEILGMARALGISTTEFLARFADNGGTTLRTGADGGCVFLTPSGCRVHARRPLVCRLYPLGRSVDETGLETFAEFPSEPGCRSTRGAAGTIDSFLQSQGVGPYLEWAQRYGRLYGRMLRLLEGLGVEGRIDTVGDGGPSSGEDERDDSGVLSSWQDLDASLAEYCAATGRGVPAGIEEAIALHLAAMEEWLAGLESRSRAAAEDKEE